MKVRYFVYTKETDQGGFIFLGPTNTNLTWKLPPDNCDFITRFRDVKIALKKVNKLNKLMLELEEAFLQDDET